MNWKAKPLGSCIEVFDSCRRPVTKKDRVLGPYPYYGASGIVDYVDSYIFEGLHVLVAEDGENLRSRKLPIAYLADGRFWVNNHAHVLRANDENDTRFLSYMIESLDLSGFITGSTQPKLSQAALLSIPLRLPKLAEQRRIAGVLGALDDKIDLLNHQRTLCRKLGLAYTERLTRDSANVPLEYYTRSISRGVTPKYYKNEEETPIHVLNQRCVRDGWVSLNSARLMLPRRREKKAAMAEFGDLLVNSTGQGTLGRVGRWSHQAPIYADSHMTIVKADPQRIYPILLPYLVFPLQSEIEQMAEGSTGQTELSPSNLGSLKVPLIRFEEQGTVAAQLLALEEMAHHCSIETRILTELRDTLLPELMSGRMRVDEAERLVSEALDEEVADV